jgi:hypothetical protein
MEKIILVLENIKYLDEEVWPMIIESFDATWTGKGGL